MNTNNALERIDLPGGTTLCVDWANGQDQTCAILSKGEAGQMKIISMAYGEDAELLLEMAKTYNAAMQPQVSESDAVVVDAFEVAKRIHKNPKDYNSNNQKMAEGFLALYARHRQPAAVSADAVELLERIFKNWYGCLPEKGQAFNVSLRDVQAAMNACRLDGARKMQEGLAEHFEKNGCEKVSSAIRALSPETVCGGE